MVSREQATGPMWKMRMLFLLSSNLEKTIQLPAMQTSARAATGTDSPHANEIRPALSRSRIGQTPTLSP